MNEPAIEYRDYIPDDRESVIRILSEGRGPRYQATKAAVFDWQFGSNPHNDGRAPFIVGTLGGEIVAVNGLMPVLIRYRRTPCRVIWSCDTFVSGRCRGRGYAKAILSRISKAADVVLGYGISDMSDPIFAKQGWELSADLQVFFFHSAERGLRGSIKTYLTRICRLIERRRIAAAAREFSVSIAAGREDFGAEADELWQRCCDGYESIVERDAAYMTWKYRRHPRLVYTTYEGRKEDRLEGLLIARYNREESVIVDYCGPAEAGNLKRALVDAAVRDLMRRGTARIRCETTDREMITSLRICGFRKFEDARARFRVRSNLPGDGNPTRGFFIMTGDSDQDFLFEAQ